MSSKRRNIAVKEQKGELTANWASDGCSQVPADRPQSDIFAKTKMCKFYLLGICSKGEACMYAHAKEELLPIPDLFRTKLCKILISTGSCNDADCKFAHNKEQLRLTSIVAPRRARPEASQSSKGSSGHPGPESSSWPPAGNAGFDVDLSAQHQSARGKRIASKGAIGADGRLPLPPGAVPNREFERSITASSMESDFGAAARKPLAVGPCKRPSNPLQDLTLTSTDDMSLAQCQPYGSPTSSTSCDESHSWDTRTCGPSSMTASTFPSEGSSEGSGLGITADMDEKLCLISKLNDLKFAFHEKGDWQSTMVMQQPLCDSDDDFGNWEINGFGISQLLFSGHVTVKNTFLDFEPNQSLGSLRHVHSAGARLNYWMRTEE